MSMEINEKVSFSGNSKVNGVVVEQYTATIDQNDPEKVTFSRFIPASQTQLRKDNKEQCREDMAAFEDDVYAAQNAMIAQLSNKQNIEEE